MEKDREIQQTAFQAGGVSFVQGQILMNGELLSHSLLDLTGGAVAPKRSREFDNRPTTRSTAPHCPVGRREGFFNIEGIWKFLPTTACSPRLPDPTPLPASSVVQGW
jgi:hypothetical protein